MILPCNHQVFIHIPLPESSFRCFLLSHTCIFSLLWFCSFLITKCLLTVSAERQHKGKKMEGGKDEKSRLDELALGSEADSFAVKELKREDLLIDSRRR